jgi:hypothetical protein
MLFFINALFVTRGAVGRVGPMIRKRSDTNDPDPSQAGKGVTFTAFVVSNSSAVPGFPSVSVQFAVDGANAGEP